MNRTLRSSALLVAAFLLPGAAAGAAERAGEAFNAAPPNATSQHPAFAGQTRAPEVRSEVAFAVQTVAGDLDNPWAIAFLPDGRLLVTERPGRLRIVATNGSLSTPLPGIPALDTRSQGGLLDVAVDPAFAHNGMVYFSFSEPHADGTNNTAVARAKLLEEPAPALADVQVIYRQSPPMRSTGHYGSRLVFAPDGTLFVTQGDRQELAGRDLVQSTANLVGKIVRIKPDGSIPADNPFVNVSGARPEIFSLGHRNVQGAAIHPQTGELWEVEHGTRGGDELNVVRKGLNYGWPDIAYGIEYRGGPIRKGLTALPGMQQPLYYWDPVIAPGGMLFYTGELFPRWKGSLFIGGLGSQRLVRLELDGERVRGEERLLGDLAPAPDRIRDVAQGPEGAIYVLTESPQGRILRLVPR